MNNNTHFYQQHVIFIPALSKLLKDQFDISGRSREGNGAEGTSTLEPAGSARDGNVSPVFDGLLRGDVATGHEAVVVGQTVHVEARLRAHHQLGNAGRTQADGTRS